MPKKKPKRTVKKAKLKTVQVEVNETGLLNAWSDRFYLMAHDFARRGLSNETIAQRLRASTDTFQEWLDTKPAFAEAIQVGRNKSTKNQWLHLKPKQRAFLTTYTRVGNISQAAIAVGVSRRMHNKWLNEDGDLNDPGSYASCFRDAKETAIDFLEGEAIRRARDGVTRMKFHQGQPIMVPCLPSDPEAMEVEDGKGNKCFLKPYVEHHYSDNLLMFLLKSNRRDVYGDDPQVAITNNTISLNDLVQLTHSQEPKVIDAEFVNAEAQRLIESHREEDSEDE